MDMAMNRAVELMMSLIRSEVCGNCCTLPETISESDIAALYRLSKYHDLAHIVGTALKKQDLLKFDETAALFEKQILTALYRYDKSEDALSAIRKIFSNGSIRYIPLKGAVLRNFYPEPWQRTSCDIDILVQPESATAATDLIVRNLNCQPPKEASHDIQLLTQNGVHIELHFTLMEDEYINRKGMLLKQIWDFAFPSNDHQNELLLPDNMYYYYHLAHMAKHIEHGGCGVRPFLDLWILNHLVPHDERSRRKTLSDAGLDCFADAANRLSEYWFSDGSADELTSTLEKYILNAGVYGSVDNSTKILRMKQKSNFSYCISRLFMPYKPLTTIYPSLKKYPYLLPFYEAARWCKLFRKKVFKSVVDEVRLASSMSDKQIESTGELLDKLGLM